MRNSIVYGWLEQELSEIRWKRFHVVDGSASDELRTAIEQSPIPVSPSYREFALRFGNTKLYQVLGTAYYRMNLHAAPREVQLKKTDEDLLLIGRYGDVYVYFRVDDLLPGEDSPIYEGGRNGFRRVGDNFHSWLEVRAHRMRKKYSKRDWIKILRGPDPFTEEELRIVEARRLFMWRVIGFGEAGDLQFEVENGSSMRLPYLSIGIRAKDGSLLGGLWLPVSHIAPGETAIVEKHAYERQLEPSNVEAFVKPDPAPEERERYWEFRK